MIIAADGYELGREARGVGRVEHNLLLRLPEFLSGDKIIVFTRDDLKIYTHPQVKEYFLPSRGGYLTWLNGPLRRQLKKAQPDLFIGFNYLLPLFCPWDSVLFEHDISVISHPEWYPRKYALSRKFLVRRSLEKAKLIFVPSEFVREEILGFFDLRPERIKVLSWGVEEKFKRKTEEEIRRFKEEKGLGDKKVIGFLGSLFKRRHIPALVGAVRLLREEFDQICLYIVGKDLSGSPAGEITKLLNKEWIRWEVALPDEELSLYYSSLDIFAYLSEYEGFGLPPLEALACGTPVLILNRSPLREIYEGMAIEVEDPGVKEIRDKLAAALTDQNLNAELLSRFEQRRSRFSWKAAAHDFSLYLRKELPP